MSEQKNNEQIQNQNDDNKYALQMQIITFQDQTINNLKSIILEKEQEIQKKNQENNTLKLQISNLQNQIEQIQQQQSIQQNENSNFLNLQSQHIKVIDELKKLKVIFNQNSNPDIVMESLQLKEQMIILSQQKTKLEIELKETQTRLIQAQALTNDLQRDNYQMKTFNIQQSIQTTNNSQMQFNKQDQYPSINNNMEDNQKQIRKIQLINELRLIPRQNRTSGQERRAQQIEDELTYLDQF